MGASIVLADDDPDIRTIYGGLLRSEGYEVCEACDGAEAIALVLQHRPALLLLDVWMPDVNGYEVLARLRHDPAVTTTRVVMLSNLGDADSRLEGFSGGVVDYWVKGLSLEELRDRVRHVLEGTAETPKAF
jgi:DNA-binding response OmpR family regulator